MSVSAAGEDDSLEFSLDGEILPWETRGSDDREFYDWFSEEGFSEGLIHSTLYNTLVSIIYHRRRAHILRSQ